MNPQHLQLINRVWNDKDFLRTPRKEIGRDKDDKPTYQFWIDKDKFYVEGEKVYADFINSKNEPMRYVFYINKYNLHQDQPSEVLICGTEFVQS